MGWRTIHSDWRSKNDWNSTVHYIGIFKKQKRGDQRLVFTATGFKSTSRFHLLFFYPAFFQAEIALENLIHRQVGLRYPPQVWSFPLPTLQPLRLSSILGVCYFRTACHQ